MHSPPLVHDLAMILGVAAVVTFIFQKIRQPVVLGYIVAGMIVGPHTPALPTVHDLPSIQVWAELGVVFLMFSLGLEFTFHKLMRVGRTAGGTATVEVVLMLLLGYGTGKVLGWSHLDSIFLGGILSISSTTIIIRAFDELNLKSQRFVEIVFGALIVEDLVAILLLVGLSTVAVTQTFFSSELLFAAMKLILIVGSWFVIGYFFIPTFVRYAGRSMDNEGITVLSTGLCLGLVVIATRFEYSAALGAFIMGSILAESSEAHRIETLVKPLKDLFAAVFFVSVGMLVDPKVLLDYWAPILSISVVTIVGKIVSTSLGALVMGQPLKRSVQIGFSLAQIGEFSFIIASLGSSLKVTSDFLYPVAVTVSVITTFTTPYLIRYSSTFASFLERVLPKRIVNGLAKYSAWALREEETATEKVVDRRQALTFLLNGIVVTLIFFAVLDWGLSRLSGWIGDTGLTFPIGWALAFVLSGPFLWGMVSSFRSPVRKNNHDFRLGVEVPRLMGHLLTVIWVGALSSTLLPLGTTLLASTASALFVFIVFYRRLEKSYRWFERHFLANVQGSESESGAELGILAPWDLRLTRLEVDTGSTLSGATIREQQIRRRFGLNIVAIQRGDEVIIAPKAEDTVFPHDELLVLGTDEEISSFSEVIRRPKRPDKPRSIADYALRRISIEEGSPFAGTTIRQSGIREKLEGLVVGLERQSERTVNPDPELVLALGDVLWLVSTK